MSTKDEDTLPNAYKYSWTAQSDLSVQDFLSKYRPSMVQNDGTKPWIWVRGSESSKEDTGVKEATEEAAQLLKEVTEKVENIKNDETIPIRSNKKTGAKSKKELREQVQSEATEQLKDIAVKHGYVSGKWLIFAPADKIDIIWTSIATSLVSGPLHSTSAYLAKVSTSDEEENSRGQHLICVYFPDVYDKSKVTEIMKVLLRNHGATLSGVKSNLYTTIGIDSKHASGIPSTIWKNTAVIPEKEAKELKDAYFAELAANKPAATEGTANAPQAKSAMDATPTDDAKQEPPKKPATKPKLKKKAAADPFGSSDDDEAAKDEPKKAPKTDKEPKAKRPQEAGEEEDEDKRPKKKRVVKK